MLVQTSNLTHLKQDLSVFDVELTANESALLGVVGQFYSLRGSFFGESDDDEEATAAADTPADDVGGGNTTNGIASYLAQQEAIYQEHSLVHIRVHIARF